MPKSLQNVGYLPVTPAGGFQAFGLYWFFSASMRPRIAALDNRGKLSMVPSGLIQPVDAPTLSETVSQGGAMDVGMHAVWVSFFRSLDNSESYPSPMTTQTIAAASSGLTITNNAVPRDPLVDYWRIYIQTSAISSAYTLQSLKIPITTKTVTFKQAGSQLSLGTAIRLDQKFIWPAVEAMAQYGNRMAGAGQIDWSPPGGATVTVTNSVSFAGANRARVVLNSYSRDLCFPEHLWWKTLYIEGTRVGTVWYVQDGQTLYLEAAASDTLTKMPAQFVGHKSRVWVSSFGIPTVGGAAEAQAWSTNPFGEYFENEFDADDGENIEAISVEGTRLFVWKNSKYYIFSGAQAPGIPVTDYAPQRVGLGAGLVGPKSVSHGPSGSQYVVSQSGVLEVQDSVVTNISELTWTKQLFKGVLDIGRLKDSRSLLDLSSGIHLFYNLGEGSGSDTVALAMLPEVKPPLPSFVKFRQPEVRALSNMALDDNRTILIFGDKNNNVGIFLKSGAKYDMQQPITCFWRSGLLRDKNLLRKLCTLVKGTFQSSSAQFSLQIRIYGMDDLIDLANLPAPKVVYVNDQNRRDWMGVPFDLGAHEGFVVEIYGQAHNWPDKLGKLHIRTTNIGE